MTYHDDHKRSIAKAITFRSCILLSDLSIMLFITHKADTAIGLIIATNVASTFIYFFHERIWNIVSWGRRSKKVK